MGQGINYDVEEAAYDEYLIRKDEKEERELENKKLQDKNKGYFVIQNINGLYLVDRSLSKRFWWTTDMSIAFIIKSEEYAKKICRNLKYNFPEVVKL